MTTKMTEHQQIHQHAQSVSAARQRETVARHEHARATTERESAEAEMYAAVRRSLLPAITAAVNTARKCGVSTADLPGLEWTDPKAIFRLVCTRDEKIAGSGGRLYADGFGRSCEVPDGSVREIATMVRRMAIEHLERQAAQRAKLAQSEIRRLEREIARLRDNPNAARAAKLRGNVVAP